MLSLCKVIVPEKIPKFANLLQFSISQYFQQASEGVLGAVRSQVVVKMASQIVRYSVPVGATFLFHGTVFADSCEGERPKPEDVYSAERIKKASECQQQRQAQPECKDTELEKLVMKGREEFGPYKDIIMEYTGSGIKQVNAYYAKLKDNICYLRTGAPQEVKIGTIVAGGLTGLLLGVRGGFFKKLILTSAGTGGGAYLAYPHETEKNVKKYTAVAYNFIAGPRK